MTPAQGDVISSANYHKHLLREDGARPTTVHSAVTGGYCLFHSYLFSSRHTQTVDRALVLLFLSFLLHYLVFLQPFLRTNLNVRHETNIMSSVCRRENSVVSLLSLKLSVFLPCLIEGDNRTREANSRMPLLLRQDVDNTVYGPDRVSAN